MGSCVYGLLDSVGSYSGSVSALQRQSLWATVTVYMLLRQCVWGTGQCWELQWQCFCATETEFVGDSDSVYATTTVCMGYWTVLGATVVVFLPYRDRVYGRQ
ncbi:hypothetical protein J6590_095469 [Homalodisca vitripennis]|nr:hypothetical protein J6590_095469 [Homalodisca vitripennis]